MTPEAIFEKGSEYVLPVKENQPRQPEALQGLFDGLEEMPWVDCHFFRTVEKGHGRKETRVCKTTSGPERLEYVATLGEWRDP